jgi:hypothetical protein
MGLVKANTASQLKYVLVESLMIKITTVKYEKKKKKKKITTVITVTKINLSTTQQYEFECYSTIQTDPITY